MIRSAAWPKETASHHGRNEELIASIEKMKVDDCIAITIKGNPIETQRLRACIYQVSVRLNIRTRTRVVKNELFILRTA